MKGRTVLYSMLVFVPASFWLAPRHASPTALFVVSCLAIVPRRPHGGGDREPRPPHGPGPRRPAQRHVRQRGRADHRLHEPTAEPEPEIGSKEHPIKVLFVPSVEADVIVSGGQIMADALKEATGLNFEVVVPTSYAATIEEMCASPTDTMGFIPGLGYALANQLCGVDVAFKAVRFGFPVYWAQFLVPRDSEYQTLEDLNGLKWGYGDPGSTSNYMVPLVMMQEAGVEPGESVQTGGHPQAALAVYRGDVDFATTFNSVPLQPDGSPAWTYDQYLAGEVTEDMWDIPADLIESCAPNEDASRLLCSDWRVLDARANARTDAPDIMGSGGEHRIAGVADSLTRSWSHGID